MKSIEIRKKFFNFFKKHNHAQVASSSLIPAQDPTLLFANAGMNQFKDVFLGLEKRSYNKAVTIQKCVRAGGKHNDLDNVGFTKRHLTFFEMMGNFSFGDYFKKEAIQFAWNFLTKEMALPTENLHVSVYTTDDESYDIWHKQVGVSQEKIHRLGASENFWQMGDTGPCGPCTEIHMDRGAEFGCKEKCDPACECDRFLEIWNLVFMQYDRQVDGSDKPLKQTGVDTGMGLERLCSVMQDKDSVFETDLFDNIIKATEKITGINYAQQDAKTKAAFHVLADHIRSSSLLIADGCAPSNDGRGYVLRKIIRRAALFAQKLTNKSIFPELSQVVVDDMGQFYPELVTNKELIYKILQSEIKKFATNLVRGKAVLEKYFAKNQDSKTISGEQAFKLYDTFGFPTELVELIAQENSFTVDSEGFAQHMQKQKEQSGKKVAKDELVHVDLDSSITTEFTGYHELETVSEIITLIDGNNIVKKVAAGSTCWIVTKKSPYFIVGGGQVPDNGWIAIGDQKTPLLKVQYINNAIGVQIKTPVELSVGTKVTSIVHEDLRVRAMKNHTATHMLQSALIKLFGKQIQQSGSLVHPDYLRFDFTYHENLSPADIKKVENLVNQKITENIPLDIQYMTYKEAISKGALAFFGDKYNPEKVRLVNISNYSAELCGGTHVSATGEIGVFKITEVTALSAGHRRIFAMTGPKAVELFQESFSTVKNLSQQFKVKREEVLASVEKQTHHIKELQSHIKQLKKQMWQTNVATWAQETETAGKVPFLFLALENFAHDELKEIAQTLGQKKPGMYFLTSTVNNRPVFLSYLSSEFTNTVNLKNFAAWLKDSLGIRGGGSKNILQGGTAKFDKNLKSLIKEWLVNN